LSSIIRTNEVKKTDSDGNKFILEKLIYQLYFEGYGVDEAFDFFDKEGLGFIGKNELIYGITTLNLDFSAFELGKIIDFLELGNFTKITRKDWKTKLYRFMKENEINIFQDFAVNLLSRIKYLIEVKNANLMEAFEEEDIHKSNTAGLEMLCKCLRKFGLNSKIFEVKTLVKMFREDEDTDIQLQSDHTSHTHSSNSKKTLSLPSQEMLPQKIDREYDLNNPAFKINYRDFVHKIYEEVENNNRLYLRTGQDLLRKFYTILKMKGISIFEAFIMIDSNNSNTVSIVEFKIALKALEVKLESLEIKLIWNLFQKNRQNKVIFKNFFEAFINSGVVEVLKLDDQLFKITKKFVFLLSKRGNAQEVFALFDPTNKGFVTFLEFKKIASKMHFDLREEDFELLFKVITQSDQLASRRKPLNSQKSEESKVEDPSQKSQNSKADKVAKSERCFNFKNLVAVISHFRNEEKTNEIIYKLDLVMKERGLTYQHVFEEFLKTSDPKAYKQAKVDGTKKREGNFPALNHRDMKKALKCIGTGLFDDEIDCLVDAFENELIPARVIELRAKNVVVKIKAQREDKDQFLLKLIQEFRSSLLRENVSIGKLFLDFNINRDGVMGLGELQRMVEFLGISINKKQLRMFFEQLDFEQKDFVTLKDIELFLYDRSREGIDGKNKENKSLNQNLVRAKEQLKTEFEKQRISLENLISSLSIKSNEVVTFSIFEKILSKANFALKREEIELILKEASDGSGACSFEDLISWSIRNNLDGRGNSKSSQLLQISPSLLIILQKFILLLAEIELKPEEAFVYFCDSSEFSRQKDFVSLFQAFNFRLSEEDLLGLTKFFDDKNTGEITKDLFAQKIDQVSNLKLSSDTTIPKARGQTSVSLLSLKHQAVAIIEKIYSKFLHKGYNKSQIKSVFDQQGKGMISRTDFIAVINSMNMGISLDDIVLLFNFLDKESMDALEVSELVDRLIDFAPESVRELSRNKKALAVIGSIKHRVLHHNAVFVKDLLGFEQRLVINDRSIPRTLSGISVFDFYKILSRYNIFLDENEKLAVSKNFGIKNQNEMLNLESLYFSYEMVSKLDGSANITDIEAEYLWEQRIIRQIVDQLKSSNINFSKLIQQLDPEKFGYIRSDNFKQLLLSLNLRLSIKDVDLLCKKFASNGSKDIIIIKEFQEHFWGFFFGRGTDLSHLNYKSKQRQLISIFHHKIKEESGMSFTQIWNHLDVQNTGEVTCADFRVFLNKFRFNLSNEELGMLFSSLDLKENGHIDQFELAEVWNSNFIPEADTQRSKLSTIENEIFSNLRTLFTHKYPNYSFHDIENLFQKYDINEKGHLNKYELRKMLIEEFNLSLSELSVDQLIRILNSDGKLRATPEAFDSKLKESHFKWIAKNAVVIDLDDAEMVNFRIKNHASQKTDAITHFTTSKKQLAGQNANSNHHLKNIRLQIPHAVDNSALITNNYDMSSRLSPLSANFIPNSKPIVIADNFIENFTQQFYRKAFDEFGNILIDNPSLFLGEYLKKFDADFDGFLTIDEVFNFISHIDQKLKNYHKMKISQCFASNRNHDRICISQLVNFICEKIAISSLEASQSDSIIELGTKNANSILSNDLFVTSDQLEPLINKLDPFTNFVQGQHQASFYLAQFNGEHLDQSRGFSIPVYEMQMTDLESQIETFEKELDEFEHLISAMASKNLTETAQCFHINSKFNTNISMDFEMFPTVKRNLSSVELPEIDELDFKVLMNDSARQVCAFEKENIADLNSASSKTKTVRTIVRSFSVEINDFKLSCGVSLREYLTIVSQAQVKISKSNTDSPFFSIYGICNRKNPINPSKTELVILEELPDESSWVSLRQLIEKNGGLLRIPFLVASNSLPRILIYLLGKLCKILDILHKSNIVLYALSPDDIFIDKQTLEIKLKSISNCGIVNENGKLEVFLDKEVLLQRLSSGGETFFTSPEALKQSSVRNFRCDSYILGCVMNYLIFGEYFKISSSEETSSQQWKIFDDSIIEAIARYDYGIIPEESEKAALSSSHYLQKCLGSISYIGKLEAILKQCGIDIFKARDTEEVKYEHIHEAGKFLDLMNLLLSQDPNVRPTVRSILNGKFLSQEKMTNTIGQQYTLLMFNYQSSSRILVKNVLEPVIKLSLSLLSNQEADVLSDVSRIFAAIRDHFTSSKAVLQTPGNKNLVDPKESKEANAATFTIGNQQKCPQSNLVDFLMNYHVLDLLLFLSLKSHKAGYEIAIKAEKTVSKQLLEPLESFKEIIRSLLDSTNSPSSIAKNYIERIMILLVKFVHGEPFILLSENLEFLNEFYNISWKSNLSKEYGRLDSLRTKFELIHSPLFDTKLRQQINQVFFDEQILKEKSLLENCWTPLLSKIALPFLREIIGSAGIGAVQYPGLQQCLSHSSLQKNSHFDQVNEFLDDKLIVKIHDFTYNPEYLEELFGLAKITEDLFFGTVGATTLKLTLNALYVTIASKNKYKIKALVDSKVIVQTLKYLGHEDPHIRENLLILIEKITDVYHKEQFKSFDREGMISNYAKEHQESNSKAVVRFHSVTKPDVGFKEIQRAFGVVAHYMYVDEDRNDRESYIACFEATGLSVENQQVADCLKTLSLCLKTNYFILNIVENLKRTVELDRNKERVIRVIEHLINAGNNMITHLSHPALDLWLTIALFLPTRTAPNKRTKTETLMPTARWLFNSIFLDKRDLLLDELRQTPCLPTLIKDQQLNIPQGITLYRLSDEITNLNVT
jgi:Ca2+-binding EF-hand superfamily protein